MNTTKTVSYKGWILSIHCVSVPGGERNGKYTAIGFLDSEAGMGNRQDGGAQRWCICRERISTRLTMLAAQF